MTISQNKRLYLFFFVSGFCSLVYQMVWTRLAFASFGIITPVLSVVLSVFMLGLAVGSWAGGRIIPSLTRATGLSAIFFYGAAEFMIGLGAFATPLFFKLGWQFLLTAGQTDSTRYLVLSALVLAASILPWCVFMGATFPWMMAYIREVRAGSTDGFSYLYFANVLGAMMGTIVTAFVLIEMFGFHHTLAIAAAGNFCIAALSIQLGWKGRAGGGRMETPAPVAVETAPELAPAGTDGAGLTGWILFTTGFCAMGLEVVWTRAFTPVLQTQVYSFALIVFTYLAATFLGSLLYRRHLQSKTRVSTGELLVLLGLAAFLPIVALDPRFLPVEFDLDMGRYFPSGFASAFVLASICPMCGVLGYLTPSLIDRYAAGHPAAAGRAYGINVVGCILGPLCASYLLLPHLSERYAIVLLGVPLLALAFLCRKSLQPWLYLGSIAASSAALAWSLFIAMDFEGMLYQTESNTTVRRDYAASVASFGEGFARMLAVNGIGMTTLRPETKFMVHLPMAMHKGKPESALIICFGMGTSFRSALSWGARTTAVELVPSVPAAFGFYHADAASVLKNPNGRIIIDDGRRYLLRTRDSYDVIVIDPPPPIETAGSSLLYSREFYDAAKARLNPGGILQMWIPGGPILFIQAVARSLHESFPYVRCFPGVYRFGAHFLASMQPIESATADELVARMPPEASRDLGEWQDYWHFSTLPAYFQSILSGEIPMTRLLNPNPKIEITDDHPFNEYFFLRKELHYSP